MASRNEITVGPAGADVVGTDGRAIQTAIDAVTFRGGGTVRVLPGEYLLADSIHLRSNLTLVGDREGTILRPAPIVRSTLAVDADIGQKEITPRSTSTFLPGMGIVMRGPGRMNQMSTMPLTIDRVADGKLYLTDYIVHNFNAEAGDWVINYFPLIHGFEVSGVVVDGLTLDAKPSGMDGLEEMWGGCLYIRRGRHSTLRNVRAENCLGDGIRFGQSEHITVEDCEAAHNSEYGIHPGSHSPWTTVRRCHIHHNGSDGLYLCWGVREGVFEDNEIHHNGFAKHRNGISIGHKDTDNVLARNHVYENAKHGLCFRVKTEANGAHRNVMRENFIENNGRPEADVPAELRQWPRYEVLCCGVFIRGVTHDLTFERNVIRETRAGGGRQQHNAFYLDRGVSRVRLVDNEMSGHPGEAVVDESGSPDNDLQGAMPRAASAE